MPFNSLLIVSMLTETHFSESSIRVHMKQDPGEKVLFFKMDQPMVRNVLSLQGGLCDGLVLYYQGNKRVFCLVELKASDLGHAVEQLTNTYEHLKREMKFSMERVSCQSFLKDISWKAYIRLGTSSPKDTHRYKKTLEDTFGKKNYAIQSESDLGKFLRKC